jgi:hypothetical protein
VNFGSRGSSQVNAIFAQFSIKGAELICVVPVDGLEVGRPNPLRYEGVNIRSPLLAKLIIDAVSEHWRQVSPFARNQSRRQDVDAVLLIVGNGPAATGRLEQGFTTMTAGSGVGMSRYDHLAALTISVRPSDREPTNQLSRCPQCLCRAAMLMFVSISSTIACQDRYRASVTLPGAHEATTRSFTSRSIRSATVWRST